MPEIGPLELLVVGIIALIVLGPKRLPEVGRSLGKGIREFKDSMAGLTNDEEEKKPEVEEQNPATRV
jgi:sec-independent protein translocase protein TatA